MKNKLKKIPCPKPASSQPKHLVQSSSKHSMCAPSFSFLIFLSELELNKFLLKTSFQPKSQNFKKISFKASRTNLADLVGFFPFWGVQDHSPCASVAVDLWLHFLGEQRVWQRSFPQFCLLWLFLMAGGTGCVCCHLCHRCHHCCPPAPRGHAETQQSQNFWFA